ncbi:LysR family transcriptional regulator [Chryseobacterium piperi]|uniref:LysR family transcriptional regulator n=1 Tax=Chryseobacterium piperi TaxID=558152 RepID=UPI00068BFDEB|nr:LysR family transcriptional regulator [Chryseobacterium piperi]ASW73524.1 LysR family transcriptional regulator [Chryseobacterium piperi]
MVNFEWYRSFKAIYTTGTLTGAAQELLISQPNVSQHLSALEAHIGKQLFERKPRKMVPTDYGRLFYVQIIDAIEKLEYIEAEFRYTRPCHIPLTCVGIQSELFYNVLAPKISKVPANLVFEFEPMHELIRKQERGRLNFTISPHQTLEKNMICEPIFQEKFLLIGSSDFDTSLFDDYISKGNMDLAEKWLTNQDWYAYDSDLTPIKKFWMENFKKRPHIKPRFIIPDYNSILKGMSSCGNGITVAADFVVKDLVEQGNLKEIWNTSSKTSNILYLTYNKNQVSSEQIEMMRKLFK